MKKISIIGSTGSIGTQSLEVIDNNSDMTCVAMSCGTNIDLFEKQIRHVRPEIVSVARDCDAKDLKVRIADVTSASGKPIEILSGMEGLKAVAAYPESDITVTAIVGMIGVEPTLAAIEAGNDIALANKETLVTAGHLVMSRAKEKGISILPVDSEHSAIFQSLQGNQHNEISRILLTASGGPFRGRTREELKDATMMNKGLEVIEAHWLFDVPVDKIEVLVQPQSIIHSAVEYADGAVIAQLGTPDMKLPIQYALTYPDRRFLPGERLDFGKMAGIYIEKPDRDTFKGLDIAGRASKIGGSMPTVMNEANEYAVAKFLKGDIRFLDIYDLIEKAMDAHKVIEHPSLEDILATRDWTDEYLRGQEAV